MMRNKNKHQKYAVQIFFFALALILISKCALDYKNFEPRNYSRYRPVSSDLQKDDYLTLTNDLGLFPEYTVISNMLYLKFATIQESFLTGNYSYEIWTTERLKTFAEKHNELNQYWPNTNEHSLGVGWISKDTTDNPNQ